MNHGAIRVIVLVWSCCCLLMSNMRPFHMLSVIVEEHTFDLSLKVDGFRRYDLFFEIWVIFGYDVTDDVTYPQSPQIC